MESTYRISRASIFPKNGNISAGDPRKSIRVKPTRPDLIRMISNRLKKPPKNTIARNRCRNPVDLSKAVLVLLFDGFTHITVGVLE